MMQAKSETESNLFDFSFNTRELDLIRTFKTLTKIDNLTQFSSDDFRMYGLDRFIKDRQHGIGGFFAKLVKNKIVRQVGHKHSVVPSSHFHEIKVYEWNMEDKKEG